MLVVLHGVIWWHLSGPNKSSIEIVQLSVLLMCYCLEFDQVIKIDYLLLLQFGNS